MYYGPHVLGDFTPAQDSAMNPLQFRRHHQSSAHDQRLIGEFCCVIVSWPPSIFSPHRRCSRTVVARYSLFKSAVRSSSNIAWLCSNPASASWAEVASRPAASNLSTIPRCRATILRPLPTWRRAMASLSSTGVRSSAASQAICSLSWRTHPFAAHLENCSPSSGVALSRPGARSVDDAAVISSR
jgi:hypothetical protein